MFDIGFQELVLVGIVALVVLGPERLPEVARTAGRWMGKARQFINNVKRDLDSELNSEDLAEFKRLKEELSETRRMLQESSSEFAQELNRTIPLSGETPPSAAPVGPALTDTEPKADVKKRASKQPAGKTAKKAPKQVATTKKPAATKKTKKAPAAKKTKQGRAKKKKAVTKKKKHG